MISLFLNTSTNYLNSAIVKDGLVIDEVYTKLDKNLSKETLIFVSKLIDDNGFKPNDIDEIVCTSGPGSFTGLRVGATISKTFAYFLEKKLYSVSTLFVMATSIKGNIIVPIIDARRGYVYGAIYDKDYNIILEEQYIKLDDLKERVSTFSGVTFVSNDEFDFVVSSFRPDILNLYSHMEKTLEDSMTFVPNYLKKPEAEEKLNDKRD